MTSKKSSRQLEDKTKDRQRPKHNEAKSWAREWMDAIIFAGIAALIIRALFLEAYRIPTPSMESTLLTGDFLLVSKMHYGARSPMSLGIPFTGLHIRGLELPWFRLPGFMDVKRNDIVVFNYPIDDKVVSQKTNYIKRAVAIPGDTVSIENKRLFINGQPSESEEFNTLEQNYIVEARERLRLSPTRVRTAGANIVQSRGERYLMNMTEEVAAVIEGWAEVVDVQPYILPEDHNDYARQPFTFASGFEGNHHNLDPIVVPFEGQVVTLTEDNWHQYRDIIVRYEKNQVQQSGNDFRINGVPTNEYTIRQDYYFMMGDSRDNSEDSRFWGYVPENHVVGRAFLIYFSWDSERYLPRFGRIFNLIH
ncbi:MAG: signal peptidase I [Balneolales bacterium]